VTVAGAYLIGIHKPEEGGHGHADHGEEHEDDAEESGEEAQNDDDDQPEESSDEGADKSDNESDGSDEKQDTPDTSDDESADDSDSKGPQGQEKTMEEGEGTNRTVKYADAKGGVKNRKESKNAITAGDPHSEEDLSGDKGKTAKPAAGNVASGSTSGKQEGVSNTDTKHSYDLNNDPSRSKKPEGGPDTAKVKGTVDPNRPTVSA
jgi:hypothetical protein